MGMVFTAEEVEKKHIPTLEDLRRAVDILRSRLRADPAIIAALLLGSVVRGDFNRRSDIDCMVIYKTEKEAAANQSLQALTKECKDMFVSVNFIPCDADTAKSGMHFFGPGYIGHLGNSVKAGGSIKGDTLSHLGPTVSLNDEASWYVRSKLYNLEETQTQYSTLSEERRIAFLKKALEAPLHVARKVVGQKGALADDSKANILAHYATTMPAGLAATLRELVDIDSWYSAELESQMENFDRIRYERCLKTIEAAIPKTIAFVRGNALLLDSPHTRNQGSNLRPIGSTKDR